MTRSSLNRRLRTVYFILFAVLIASFAAKMSAHVPGIKGTAWARPLSDFYDYAKDMSVVLITVIAAYLANVFQKRNNFVKSLETEWRAIVRTKSTLYAFTQKADSGEAEYLEAFCRLSENLDNMRTVYSNVGETDDFIGLYPFAPLHDMRRALQTLNPQKRTNIPKEDRDLVRHAIMQSFYALRETFLEELELESPDNPLLIFGGRRLKRPGATAKARRAQEKQRQLHDRVAPADRQINELLTALYDKEHSTAKPWRHPSQADKADGQMTAPPGQPRGGEV